LSGARDVEEEFFQVDVFVPDLRGGFSFSHERGRKRERGKREEGREKKMERRRKRDEARGKREEKEDEVSESRG
jgi:hypothetical protein